LDVVHTPVLTATCAWERGSGLATALLWLRHSLGYHSDTTMNSETFSQIYW